MSRLTLLLCVCALFASCTGAGAGRPVRPDDLGAVAERTSLWPRTVFVEARYANKTLSVEAAVADDYRYRARVAQDGVPVYEEVVVDDARYLRVLDPGRFPAQRPPSLTTLLSGAWVVDRTGAPPEFESKARERPLPLGPQLVLEVVRFPEQIPTLLTRGRAVREYNPDAADYLPQDDKFPPHEADGVRFDMLPKPFDPGLLALTFENLESFFLYASLWVEDRRITRVEKVFTMPKRSQRQYRSLLDQLERGIGGSPSAVTSTVLPENLEGTTGSERYLFSELTGTVEPPAEAVEIELGKALAVLQSAMRGPQRQVPVVPELPDLPGLDLAPGP